jgi:hypothetical protein
MNRVIATLVAAVTLIGAAVGYIALTGKQSRPASGHVEAPQRMLFLTNGQLSWADRADPGGAREITEEKCDRVGMGGETVACPRPVDALVGTKLVIFDKSLVQGREIKLTGFPNRLRVSADGRMVAWTLFVDGHSYATTGFSTLAGILDTRTGTTVTSLEDFRILKDGRPYTAVDVNFWGITFAADDNRFYATMSTGGQRYLVEGDFAGRTVRTMAVIVECPSLSQDGRRLAYKQAVEGDPKRGWRLTVMDLTSGVTTPTAETRSVDDQALWLDAATIAYTLQRSDGINDIWSVPADGSGTPTRVVSEAGSPAL